MSRRRRGNHQENGSSEQEETADADTEQAALGESPPEGGETADGDMSDTGGEIAADGTPESEPAGTGDETATADDEIDGGEDTDDEELAETADVEVVDAQPPEKAEYVQNARTYEFEENGVAYRVVPVIERGGRTRWVVQANAEGVQGQLFRDEHIGDDAADSLGLSRATQDRINAVLEDANENMELPPSLRGQTMENAPLSDLETALGGVED